MSSTSQVDCSMPVPHAKYDVERLHRGLDRYLQCCCSDSDDHAALAKHSNRQTPSELARHTVFTWTVNVMKLGE